DQWAVLSLSCVRKGRFDASALKPISRLTQIPEGIQVCYGDILVTRSNTRKLVGDAALVTAVRDRTVRSDLIYRLRYRKAVEPGFLLYQLLSPGCRIQMEREARRYSGTMAKLAQRHIRGLILSFPPKSQQVAMKEYLEAALAGVEEAA